MSEDFSIEAGDYGPSLVLHSDWRNEYADYMLTHNIKELTVNYAWGFCGQNLDFFQQVPFLEGLRLLVYRFRDISPVHSLHELRSFMNACRDVSELDFSQFPKLERCGLDWRKKVRSLSECETLKWLYVGHYSRKDTAGFAKLVNLESLEIASSPVESLEGLGSLRGLKMLGLYNLRCLSSLKGVENLLNLENLHIMTCGKLTDISEVRFLSNLQALNFDSWDDIASLEPLKHLPQLKRVGLVKSTNIMVGDSSVFTPLPHLERVYFNVRRYLDQRRKLGTSTLDNKLLSVKESTP